MQPIICKSLRYVPEKSGYAIVSYDSRDRMLAADTPEYFVNHILCGNMLGSDVYVSSIGHDRSWPGRVNRYQDNPNMMTLHYITREEVKIDGKIIREGGFFIVMPGQVPAHEIEYISDHSELYYLIIKGKGLAEFIVQNCYFKTRQGSYAHIMFKIIDLFSEIIYGQHDDTDTALHIYGCAYQILAYQKNLNLNIGAAEHRTTNPIAIQAMQIITEKFPEKLSVSDIARKLHICPDYLSKILRNEVGCSAQTLITKKRMMQARYLLLQKPYKKLTDVAILCGYNDYVFFCKHFHKYNGLSPNAYRKQAELNILTMPDF